MAFRKTEKSGDLGSVPNSATDAYVLLLLLFQFSLLLKRNNKTSRFYEVKGVKVVNSHENIEWEDL